MGTYIYKAPTKGQRKTNLGTVRLLSYWYKPYWCGWGGNPAAKLDALRDRLDRESADTEILCVVGDAFQAGEPVFKRKGIIWYDCDDPGEVVGILAPAGRGWRVVPHKVVPCLGHPDNRCYAKVTVAATETAPRCHLCAGLAAGTTVRVGPNSYRTA